jgi:uncharacterized protein
MRIHVSLHDVSPAFARELEAALDLCHAAGAKPALLVVPNYHGEFPLEKHPEFTRRLVELADSGHEIYLHGFFHQARAKGEAPLGNGRPGKLARLVAQRVVSAGEAEFSDLGRSDAASRLEEGERLLRAVGLEPSGFVPPAWSMPGWMLDLLRERGHRHTEDHLRIYDPTRGRSRGTLLINWATRSRARLWSTVVFGRFAWPAGRWLPTRIAIHPRDLDHSRVKREIALLLHRARGRFVSKSSELWEPP